MSQGLSSRLAGLNPFAKAAHGRVHGDDKGETIDQHSVGGATIHHDQPPTASSPRRVSRDLQDFLAKEGLLTPADLTSDLPSQALQRLVAQPYAVVPPALTDPNHPLPEYYISSSHNTYLSGHQLYGSSNVQSFETALTTGSRCVEIDAWDDDDNPSEPKVTHGYTLVSNISFRAVCQTIRRVSDDEAKRTPARHSPIFISLENHCGLEGQANLVQIMREELGERLLADPLHFSADPDHDHAHHVRLADIGSKIAMIVEFPLPEDGDDASSSSSSDSSSDDEEDSKVSKRAEKQSYKAAKKANIPSKIIPSLTSLGVYAQSVKPRNNSWFANLKLDHGPHHHLINISETGLSKYLPENSAAVSAHNSKHLMRVFPKGTRISSRNLDMVPYWGIGAQICALNWQTFGASMQLNQALFTTTDGYVLKPAALRPGGSGKLSTGRRATLKLHVAGATDLPPRPEDDDKVLKPYLSCILVHPDNLDPDSNIKRKTAPYKQHHLSAVLPHSDRSNAPPTDPIWHETLEWEYEENELVFLRILIKSDDSFARNPICAVAAVRLSYVQPGWKFIPMLDLKGRDTKCTLLARFEISTR